MKKKAKKVLRKKMEVKNPWVSRRGRRVIVDYVEFDAMGAYYPVSLPGTLLRVVQGVMAVVSLDGEKGFRCFVTKQLTLEK